MASVLVTACVSELDPEWPDADAYSGEDLWAAIDGYRAWEQVDHRGAVRVYVEEPGTVVGVRLSSDAEPGALVVTEHYVGTTLVRVQGQVRGEGDAGWLSVAFTPQGRIEPLGYRESGLGCIDCHGSRDMALGASLHEATTRPRTNFRSTVWPTPARSHAWHDITDLLARR